MLKYLKFLLLPFLLCAFAVACGDSKPKQPAVPQVLTVKVTTMPDNAQIYVNGNPETQRAPCELKLALNTPYLISADLPGHRQAIQLVDPVGAPAVKEISLRLEPYYGVLVVESQPEGAAITVDNKPVGAAPARMYAVSVGEHKIRAELHGHLPVEVSAVVPPDGSPTAVKINLESMIGTLNVTSPTPDVAVFVNGAEVGYAPYKATVPEGAYDVVLKKDGFGEVQRKVEVKRMRETVVNEALHELPSSLVITTQPEKAEIYFKNELRGLSPVTIDNVAPGRYTVVAKKEGYDTEEANVRVNPGAPTPVNIKLTANTGEIHVTATPPGISVYLDGHRKGSMEPDPMDPKKSKVFVIPGLQAGSYQVRIAHKDGRPASQTEEVTVSKGATARTAPMKIWVPNAWIKTKASNVRQRVCLEAELPDEVIYQPVPGVTMRCRRDELAAPVEHIDIRETFEDAP